MCTALTLWFTAAPAVVPACPASRLALAKPSAPPTTAAAPLVAGAEPAPRWTLKRLVAWCVSGAAALLPRAIRAALHRRSELEEGQEAARPGRPGAAAGVRRQVESVLAAAQRDQHLLVYLDEAHSTGCRTPLWLGGTRPAAVGGLQLAGSPAKVSFYGLYLFNEAQARLWPTRAPTARHHRRAASAARRAPGPGAGRAVGRRSDHRAGAVRDAAATLNIELMPLPGYSPDLMPVEALWPGCADVPTITAIPAGTTSPVASPLPGPRQSTALVLADRLWLKDQLDPEEEKLRFSTYTRFRTRTNPIWRWAVNKRDGAMGGDALW